MQTEYVTVTSMSSHKAKAAITRAGDIIRAGGLVVFPTETVYGLGGDATNPTAAKNIYAAKGRPSDNPLIIHVADPKEAELYVHTCDLYYKFANAFMPGPITVIMPVKDTIPKSVTAELDTVAVRCPSNEIAQALIRASGVPIAAPSANLSGSPSPTCGKHVADDMMGRVDMIIDGGECDIGLESTIVKIENKDTVILLRPGAVTVDALHCVCENVIIAPAVLGALKEGDKVLSPGMKYRHYAPSAPLFLLDGDIESRVRFISSRSERIALLCYDDEMEYFRPYISDSDLYPIGKHDDTDTQAHKLFGVLRAADKIGYDEIYAPLPDENGMGLALYNRLIRAAAHQILIL